MIESLLLPRPYLLFLGDVTDPHYAKTAFGLRDWIPDQCVGEFSCAEAGVTTGLPRLSPAQARAQGARSLLIGVANVGGVIPHSWIPSLVEALDSGLDIVSGLHARLGSITAVREAAQRNGCQLIDIRQPPSAPVATGRKRTGKRLLTVGTDCALGKKYTALSIARAFRTRGIEADFRATGQTGIMIAGSGVPIDAVVADFCAGAAERLSPDAPDDHWDIIEGQGSLFHPAYAGVSLALLHGSQPDVIVLCHDPRRTHLLGYPDFAMPDLREAIEANLLLGRRVNPAIRCAGIAFNTSGMPESEATRLLANETARTGLPVADPVRGGIQFERLLDACVNPPVETGTRR